MNRSQFRISRRPLDADFDQSFWSISVDASALRLNGKGLGPHSTDIFHAIESEAVATLGASALDALDGWGIGGGGFLPGNVVLIGVVGDVPATDAELEGFGRAIVDRLLALDPRPDDWEWSPEWLAADNIRSRALAESLR